MSACLMIGGVALGLAAGTFELEWTHSVEKIGWRESWRVEDGALHLDEARVRGSGAGMEPGPEARLQNGWWVWAPGLSIPALDLAASGATGAGWRLCADGNCREIGTDPGKAIHLTPC
ncbi:DUF1850 domain-containing protein [Limimaricola hongkongensis]|uniref:DUF1850 domain-containing protein n=1 Tax=Limimaricola hongkongensis DSM 17492 TaxID=1122180 RepID=A0A017HIU6_9RHOB|nr:DUF1850 domain-containing protein [Limimaricola hongkongensis]EYD73709.1 hypothetical protein Lokhon_00264 [Limimaricola hongkongensis DSM 17492]